MSKPCIISIVLALAACNDGPKDCTVICSTDAECPDGQSCGELGRCSGGATCPCTVGEFLGCAGPDTGRVCNASGNGLDMQTCAAGCNAGANRCNECVANSSTCNSTGMVVEHCDENGLRLPDESCGLSCSGGTADHCPYIAPKWLPDVCDTTAPMASLAVGVDTTLDTSSDSSCTGGIITQTGGPEICLVRYGTITIGAKLVVSGSRAVAFVADGALQVTGTLDVSANGSTNGPGGGTINSGGDAQENLGGGGAGFKQIGAPGGGTSGPGGSGAPGGAVLDPLAQTTLIGGPHAGSAAAGGGGGGAALLISCRNTVTVGAAGVIDAGGGGGAGGADVLADVFTRFYGGRGGGAGGYVVLQGTQVNVAGRIFANGGGGGGGCIDDDCVGNRGSDGGPTETPAAGGPPLSGTGQGGAGGSTTGPNPGMSSTTSPGAGGGATGRVQVYTPQAVTPMLSSPVTSPPYESNLTVPTR